MNLSFIGTVQSGKTTAVTLLHLKSLQMQLDHKINYRPVVSQDGVDLFKLGEDLRNGRPVSPTDPRDGFRRAQMEFSFPSLMRDKRLQVSTVDASGELMGKLLRALPDVGYDLADMEDKLATWGLSKEEADIIWDNILNCEAFVCVVDGVESARDTSGVSDIYQDTGLAHFISNLKKFKDHNRNSPRLKGLGILVTKTDEVNMPLLPRDPDPSQIDAFMRVNMFQSYGSITQLCQASKVQPTFFYHHLRPSETDSGNGNGKGPRFRVDKSTRMVEYPEDQYEGMIDWFRTLVG